MKFAFRVVFFLFIFFLVSCKKDKKDNQPPVITVNSPISGQHFNMFDTITVNARVADNEHLSYINVTLTNLNHTPLQASYSVPITSADFTFNIKYILTQFHLQSGTYYIQITADDGYNTVSFYQPIIITESPTQLWGYCVVMKNSNQTITQYDTLGVNTISTISLSQPYNGMKYGAYNEQLYINGNGAEAFQAFYLAQQSSNQSAYSVSATVNQQNYTCLYTDGNKPYVGFFNGDIYSFNSTGSYSTSYRLNDNTFYPYCFTTTTNYGVAAFKSKNATVSDKLTTFYIGSGALFNNVPLPTANFKVIAIFEKGQDSLYVLGNDSNNHAKAYIYYPPTNSFSSELPNILPDKMLSSVKINSDYIIFSTTAGIYSYQYTSSNCVLLSSNYAQKLSYQLKLNRLTAASGTNLNSYYVNPTSLTQIPTKILSDSIIDFEVITNK